MGDAPCRRTEQDTGSFLPDLGAHRSGSVGVFFRAASQKEICLCLAVVARGWRRGRSLGGRLPSGVDTVGGSLGVTLPGVDTVGEEPGGVPAWSGHCCRGVWESSRLE